MSSAIFADYAGCGRERPRQLRDRRADRVPGNRGFPQVELDCELPVNVDAVGSERSQRSASAAELRRQPLGDRAEPCAGLDEAHEPRCRLVPEGRRHGLLEQRPRSHHRSPVLDRELRARIGRALERAVDQTERVPGDEHRRGVEDVLARRSPVDIFRVRLSDAFADRTDERLDWVTGQTSRFAELSRVVEVDVARVDDRRSGCCGDDVREGGRIHKCSLDFE